jgi:hypothetical protein
MSGCTNCGARAVGEALPRPARELPSYGRSLVLIVSGSLMVLVFVTQTIMAMVQHYSGSFGFWTWVAAGETAAWRLKWVAIPVLFFTLWGGLKLYRSIREQPNRFCGVNRARYGLVASAMVGLIIATLIGITVPARIRQRQMAIDAGYRAQFYTIEVALLAYRIRFGTLPTDLKDLSKKLPDPDGSLAIALHNLGDLDNYTGYKASADVAAVTQQKSPRLRGALIRRASFNTATDDTPSGGLSFTNYEIRLPGEDKVLGNDDDWVGRDGVIMRLADVAKGGVGRIVSAGALKP